MKYKQNWEETKIKWRNYWKRQNTGRPLMYVVANKDEAVDPVRVEMLKSTDMDDKYLNAERAVKRYRYFCETHEFLAESFPNMSLDLGPGSMAAYLGCEVVFQPKTIWFSEFVEDWNNHKKLEFDSENPWFKKHLELFARAKELVGDDFYIGIPDIMENVDVLASMRGAQNTVYDLIDEEDEMKKRLAEVTDIYFDYYDRFYDIAKDSENASCYTVFQIWGEGKTAKLQCDFSAMMSPTQFREYIQGTLREQAKKLDNVLYHLDGPDAIKHMDALMEIEEIDALQWTSGDYGPDGTFEEWYPIYDKAVAAGKGLWIKVYSGTIEEWLLRIDRLVKRYGTNAMFLFFPSMPKAQAEMLLDYADKNWSDIKGTF